MTASEPGRDDAASGVRRQTLDERYGVPSATRRRLQQVAVAAVALALIGWLGWAAWEQGHTDVSGRLTSFDVVDQHRVKVEVVLTRKAGTSVVCDVAAQAEDHSTVGEAQVTAPAGDTTQLTTTATVRTDRAATSATVSNCRTQP